MSDNLNDPRSVGTLVGDLIQQATSLMQTEMRLLRSEISDKARTAGSGAAEVLAGGLLLMAALLVLLQALVVALSNWMGAGWASLLVGVVVAVLGVIFVRRGMANLDPSNLTPDQTTRQFSRDAAVVKEQLK